MILHLITDEKFIDYAVKHFSIISGTSEFVLITYVKTPLRYVLQSGRVQLIVYGSHEYKSLIERLNQYSTILSHGLFEQWQHEIILAAPASVKIAWVFWGGEVYGLAQCHKWFLSPSTKLLYLAKRLVYGLKGRKMENGFVQVPISVFKRIDYCLTDEKEECEFANQLLGTSMCHVWYNYYSIEETIGTLAESQVNGMNILLGNSSTFECNHLLVMKKLIGMNIGNHQVIVPLNYGDSWLRERMLQIGNWFLGKKFQALIDFMPRDEYNKVIRSCGVVIMPHYRPQAFGNIFTALWMGAKVFISEKNITYKFLKRLGLHFYTIEYDISQEEIITPLSAEMVQHNRTILAAEYRNDSILPRIQLVIEKLNN